MSMMVSFVLSFFPRDVLDEILNLIGSVSEGFPSYSCIIYGQGGHFGHVDICINFNSHYPISCGPKKDCWEKP